MGKFLNNKRTITKREIFRKILNPRYRAKKTHKIEITEQEYNDMVNAICQYLREMLLINGKVRVGSVCELVMTEYKPKIKLTENGEIDKKHMYIDWEKTSELRKEDPKAPVIYATDNILIPQLFAVAGRSVSYRQKVKYFLCCQLAVKFKKELKTKYRNNDLITYENINLKYY